MLWEQKGFPDPLNEGRARLESRCLMAVERDVVRLKLAIGEPSRVVAATSEFTLRSREAVPSSLLATLPGTGRSRMREDDEYS